MAVDHYEAAPGDGWYSIARKLGGSQATQADKDANASYLAAANGRKDVSTGTLYPREVLWYNPAELITSTAPPAITLGPVVYSQMEIDAWSVSSPQYTRLANSWAGRLTRDDPVPASLPLHDSAAADGMRSAAVYLKDMAALWAADQEPTRLARVFTKIDQFAAMHVVLPALPGGGLDNDSRLDLGWVVTNICQAARIVGYPVGKLEPFLRAAISLMDWTNGCNWLASFADSLLAAASILGDMSLFLDCMRRLSFRMPQAIYHPKYDLDRVIPLRGPTGLWAATMAEPVWALTESHWWGQVKRPDYLATFQGVPFPAGVDGERTRDISHQTFGITGWTNAARTVRACGGVVVQHLHDRIAANADLLGQRCLQFATTGTYPDPQPSGAAGTGWYWGWAGVRRYLGTNTPQSVLQLLATSQVVNAPPAGANHQTADAFTNG